MNRFPRLGLRGRWLLVIAAGLLAITVAFCIALTFPTTSSAPAADESRAIFKAISAFVRDHPTNDWVSLTQLQDAGYLNSRDLHAFAGADLSINLRADETHPNVGVCVLRAPDGTKTVLLGDGSSQQVGADWKPMTNFGSDNVNKDLR